MNWEMTVTCPKCRQKSTHHDHHVGEDLRVQILCDCGNKFWIKFVCDPVPYYQDEYGYTTNRVVEKFYVSN